MKFWIDECLGDAQLPLFSDAIAHIQQRAEEAREAPADWMLNRVVEVDDESGECRDAALSKS